MAAEEISAEKLEQLLEAGGRPDLDRRAVSPQHRGPAPPGKRRPWLLQRGV